MPHRRVLPSPAWALWGLALPLACAGAPPPAPASSEAPAAPAVLSASAAPPASASVLAASAAAPTAAPSPPPTCGEREVRDPHGNCVAAVCPQGKVLGSDGSCKEPAPCIDGEVLMGACLCPKGKSVDETGHCVFSACPKGTTGGTVFRNETTGECMECRPGTVPCGDHCCPSGRQR